MAEYTLHWQVHDQTHSRAIQDGDRLMIGRRDDCQIIIPLPTISRQHALLTFRSGILNVRNLSRTNSVRVNEELRLEQNRRAPLTAGDTFRLGPVEFTVQESAAAAAEGELKIRCSNCRRVVDYEPESFCPWCGMALAGGQTLAGV